MSKYRRVLIKVSGEALMGKQEYGQNSDIIQNICTDIADVVCSGTEVCIVVGGGNIFRGISAAARGMERSSADYMGMLATVLNALALQNTLESMDIDTRVLSAIHMMEICEPYVRRRAIRHLERGRVVIFAAGTGNPYFTTDTAAALRASEMNCDAMLKGTQVDGVYDSDPKKNPNAKRYDKLNYDTVIKNNLQVMDTAAIALSRENNIPVIVFSISEQGSFSNVLEHKGKFTIIKDI